MPPPLRFDSALMNANDAEEIWREALRPMYELKRPREAALSAKIKTWDFGAMLLTNHVVEGEVQFHRTRKKIAASGLDQYLVHCLIAGELTSEFAQGQQRVPLNSIAIRDMAVENVGFAVDAPMLTLSVSRAALDRRLPEGARLHGASWEADDLIGAMVATHLQTLARLATGMSAEQTYLAADATLDLLAACLLPKAQPDVKRSDPRLSPMLRAQASSYIERHLLDADLGPAALCKALKISRTALYGLFAESGGVAKRVRDRRLDEALRRLTAPRHARERIAEISYSVGFVSETTFNRSFKERFGCTPSEARGEMLVKSPKAVAAGKMPDNLIEMHQRKIKGLSV